MHSNCIVRGLTLFLLLLFSLPGKGFAWSHSDVTTLAEEAIANTNASAISLRTNPNDPRFRDAYLLSLDNLALARQAIEEEFQKGAISARTRTRMLVRLARMLNQEPTGDFGSAVEAALEENPESERFVPPAIPNELQEKSVASGTAEPSFPSPIATNGSTVVFLTRDLFPPAIATQPTAVAERDKGPKKKEPLSKGYNAPSLSSSRPLGSLLDKSPVENTSDGALDLLASALDKARQSTPAKEAPGAAVASTSISKSLAPTLAPGLKSLAAGLSGKVARSSASLGGLEPEFLSLAVRPSHARNGFSWWWLGLLAAPMLWGLLWFLRRPKNRIH
ncbi:MAG: hypothetical protein H6617_08910 [Bdellovibrionaceae bacterium]|nr:hypothetical protein [Bdellovibrionales bacterium]MCB9254787.1 hypothetical protein [Pseudobdellovibrionaceae bacterium]